MLSYAIRRIIMTLVNVLFVVILVFVIIRVIPGDLATLKLGDMATPEAIAQLKHKMGTDRPLHIQFLDWFSHALRGDFGVSMWTGANVSEQIARRWPITFELAVLGLIWSTIIAVPIGVLSAVRQNTGTDYILRFASIFMLSIPGWWIATLIVTLPALWWGWMVPIGTVPFVQNPAKHIGNLVIPAFCVGLFLCGSLLRMARSMTLEVLRQDYIRTARAKGLRERVVISRHTLKNALIPIVTMMGTQFGYLLGGAVIIEMIFSLPGIGRSTVDSIFMRDYTQLQGNVLFVASVFMLVNLIVDLVYAYLDPRIKYT